MVIHPPMLYMGYVGFSVAFAFAIAALLGGRLDATWARWSRPWTTAAWCFLTIGIALGSWWAYYELGWGGWWFWDPVENASFMPWLVGTALIHSLAVTEKRGTFKSWTVLLAIVAFSLSLLGTFLVRSGVLTSVHAFATDPARGVFILALPRDRDRRLARAVRVARAARSAAAAASRRCRANRCCSPTTCCWSSRCATVLLGTLYPLFLDALDLGKISVGPPYFDAVFVAADGAARVPDGRSARSRAGSKRDAAGPVRRGCEWALARGRRRRRWCCRSSLGDWSPLVALGLLLALWVVAATVVDAACSALARRAAARRWRRSSRANPRAWYGMLLAHLGVAVFIVGVTLVKGYEVERDVRIDAATASTSAATTFTLRRRRRRSKGPNYRRCARHGRGAHATASVVETLHPEKRVYTRSGQTMTEAAIDTGFSATSTCRSASRCRQATAPGRVRVYHKPFVDWIWGGCFLMALGGFLAISDRRYRLAVATQKVARSPAACRQPMPRSPT